MVGSSPEKNRGKWVLPPGQKMLLAVLLLTLIAFYWMRGRSGHIASLDFPNKTPRPERFVAEVEGCCVSPGIYTFSTEVGIRQVLIAAGMPREFTLQENTPQTLRTGTRIALYQSPQGLHIRMESMDPAKKIVYGIPIDLNCAQADDLTLIPGIGPVLAKRIIDYRDRRRGIRRFDDLAHISGIGRKKLESLRRYLTVEDEPTSTPE